MMDMEYNRTSPFISNSLHYFSEIYPYVGEFSYICTRKGIDMTYTVIADFVKEMRRQFGLTQVDLADKSGVGLRFVRDLEQGKQTLRMDKVNQVLRLFGRQVGPVEVDVKTREDRL